ncbi:MAG: hypothetical protein J6K42_03595 [Clostridia bacterium]|nr:hypothetical protein [Clostridia bacterium]
MKNNLILKKCAKCGALVKIIEDCNCEDCGIKCCGEEMKVVTPNSIEAAVEKHIPTYERVEDEIFVKVNHVMEKEHFIEWVAMVTDTREEFVKLYPEQNAECRFKYVPGAKLYAYCNKHGLWVADVK